jgi:hypothetical protein
VSAYPPLMRPPEYGSPEYEALPADDPLRQQSVTFAADCWRRLTASPHCAEIIADLFEWERRKSLRETSNAVSAAADWRALASAPTYAELERRRAEYTHPPLTPAQIRAYAARSWAAAERRARPAA